MYHSQQEFIDALVALREQYKEIHRGKNAANKISSFLKVGPVFGHTEWIDSLLKSASRKQVEQ